MKNYVSPEDKVTFAWRNLIREDLGEYGLPAISTNLLHVSFPWTYSPPTLQQIAAIKREVLDLPQLETCQNMPGGQARYCMVQGQHMQCCCCCGCCWVPSVVSNSVRPHRQQPTWLPHPWDSPGKNTGVGCHFLLQCMKVKSESEVAQSCLILHDPMDCSPPGSSAHGIFQARVLEWGAISFSAYAVTLLFSC